jgi:hypothetical protein
MARTRTQRLRQREKRRLALEPLARIIGASRLGKGPSLTALRAIARSFELRDSHIRSLEQTTSELRAQLVRKTGDLNVSELLCKLLENDKRDLSSEVSVLKGQLEFEQGLAVAVAAGEAALAKHEGETSYSDDYGEAPLIAPFGSPTYSPVPPFYTWTPGA